MTARRAAFLDRDGTIIRDAEYLGDPAGIELLEGAPEAIARLNAANIPVIVVTNQSGIARGMLAEADYERVRARLDALLAEAGAHIDASYMCPHHPDFTGPCACRKPGVGMYEEAVAALDLDPARSWYVGDRWRDIAAAAHFGGHGFLVRAGAGTAEDFARAASAPGIAIVDSLAAAVDRILDSDSADG